MVDVINALKSDKKVYVIAAPATEGQVWCKHHNGEAGRKLCRKLDSTDLSKAGLGGDMTAASEAAEWVEAYKAGEKK